VAAHIDRTRIPEKLQLENWKRFGQFSVNDDDRQHRRGRNGDRNNGAAVRQFALVYVPSGIEILVMMDSRAMLMIAILAVVRTGVNMEGQGLYLQSEQGQDNEDRQAAHSPSLCDAPMRVNAAPAI